MRIKKIIKHSLNKYYIDIDSNSENFSKDFKEFYANHFIDSYGLTRREVDTSFFKTMTDEEKEVAKRLIRNNLELRQTHLFEAAGELNDKIALPVLYEQFDKDENLSWKLTIGRAIWRINGDKNYEKILRELATSKDENLKYAHFEQIFDLTRDKKIQFLKLMIGNDKTMSEKRALETLNLIERKIEKEKLKND